MFTQKISLYKFINVLIASVWLINGLLCKVLHLVPRHQQIVASILGESNARCLTTLIGFSEILLAAWILSGIKSKYCALLQITIVAAMNLLEFVLVPHLLLWGRWNAAFALLLIAIIYINEFHVKPKMPVK